MRRLIGESRYVKEWSEDRKGSGVRIGRGEE